MVNMDLAPTAVSPTKLLPVHRVPQLLAWQALLRRPPLWVLGQVKRLGMPPLPCAQVKREGGGPVDGERSALQTYMRGRTLRSSSLVAAVIRRPLRSEEIFEGSELCKVSILREVNR